MKGNIVFNLVEVERNLEGDVIRIRAYVDVTTETDEYVQFILDTLSKLNIFKGVDVEITPIFDEDDGVIKKYLVDIERW